jgi:hypothetical protein
MKENSGIMRPMSEWSETERVGRGLIFPNERTDPKGGFMGCIFFGPFFGHAKKGQKGIVHFLWLLSFSTKEGNN